MKSLTNFLLTGDMLIPELHLRQPRFITCWPFTKHCEKIQKFKETSDINYIYKDELDKACFAHDEAYANRKDLSKITASDKILNMMISKSISKDSA